MSFQKEARLALGMLVDNGVDFETAAELVLEKVASIAGSIALHGISDTERKLAESKGLKGPKKDAKEDYKRNFVSNAKATGRGAGTGLFTGVASAVGASALATRAIRRGATSVPKGKAFVRGMTGIGAGAGYVAGRISSLVNQGKDLTKKYQEKQAAVNMLVEKGIDFDTALDLVTLKSSKLYGD